MVWQLDKEEQFRFPIILLGPCSYIGFDGERHTGQQLIAPVALFVWFLGKCAAAFEMTTD